MAKIFYSLAGEGRGHATRVHAMVQMLRREHQVMLFTSADAYDFLEPIYRDTDVRVKNIPGMHFHYTADQKLDFLQTGNFVTQFIMGLPGLLDELADIVAEECPDLVITDFEPAVPRAAWRFDVPVVSLDHQHFLVTTDFSGLPFYLQSHAAFMGKCVEMYYSTQVETIVSSFFSPPLKPQYQDVVQVGVLLRQEFFQMAPREGDYLLVYWRKLSNPLAIEALKASGREVRIYGLGEQPDDGNLRFFPVHPQRFMEDLAGCAALVTTAGNQLLGESFYFRKPVFAIPEPNNYEQYINAYFLEMSGMGTWAEPHLVNPAHLHAFLERLEDYRAQIDPERAVGNQRALEAINQHLKAAV